MPSASSLTCYVVGSESLLVQCGDLLLDAGHRILGVISTEPGVQQWAADRGLRTLPLDDSLPALMRAEPADYFFSITNLRVLPPAVVESPRLMAINFHDGPLPRYAGLHATSWALIAEETEYAITWHRITPDGIDEGDILLQERVTIEPGETALALNAKCYEAGIRSFAALIEGIAAGTVHPRRQDLSLRTYFGRTKRPAGVGTICWDDSARRIVAGINALDFGPYPNPLALPKIWHGDEVFVVLGASLADGPRSNLKSGTVVESRPGRLVVAASDGDVACTTVAHATGIVPAGDSEARQPPAGAALRRFAPADLAGWTSTHEALAAHESFWARRLADSRPVSLPLLSIEAVSHRSAADPTGTIEIPIDKARLAALRTRLGAAGVNEVAVAIVAAFLARASGMNVFDLGSSTPSSSAAAEGADALFSRWIPLRVDVPDAATFIDVARVALGDWARVEPRRSFARDIAGRLPALKPLGRAALPEFWEVRLSTGSLAGAMLTPPALAAHVAESGGTVTWLGNQHTVPGWVLDAMARQFKVFADAVLAQPDAPLAEYPLLDPAETRQMLIEWNDTRAEYATTAIHEAFEAQAARTPDATALVFEHATMSYRTLDARANQLARRLRDAGVSIGEVVGLAVPRSIEMVVAALGILKAGAAYLPLDPDYPADRLRFMLEDSGATMVVGHTSVDLPTGAAVTVIRVGDAAEDARLASHESAPLRLPVPAASLAYLIYTSGSTGQPKGVMVEHRQVANFLAAMDRTVDTTSPGVWLAVTSLSFDISVLEIFWTLARGFTVVIQHDPRQTTSPSPGSIAASRPIDLSLFYFASDEGDRGAAKYRLLLEGARFADREGFHAVWTPERHFHAFGGLYPNPAVASAALATLTSRVAIRAGSVVLPLHHPIRVAEDWALVDNLSGGRVGVSFASGWHPEDFVLRPDAFANAKGHMMRDIDTVRRLWRGERVAFPGPLGKDVEVSTLPRPVQPELPIWVTAAGNPETFRLAGEAGCYLLTHLLGQNLEELVEKVEVYRRAWRAAGHGSGGGRVTLMLHTFVGESDESVRAIVREPMKRYLGSAISLIKQYAWSFPAFRKRTEAAGASTDDIFRQLSPEDLDGLVEHAFERYYETSGLFGTPETCVEMINRVKAIGIEEVACLIDFGVPHETVIGSFERLAELRRRVAESRPLSVDDHSIPASIERHGVTHFQCTPSLAGALVRDADACLALGRLRHMMIGGEALPASLAAKLTGTVRGRLTNMYGPTETTVWSAVHDVTGGEETVPIGRPLVNTTLYVLDAGRQPVPLGVPGELFIGGDGVARGYHRRPELEAERFVPDPFARTTRTAASDHREARLYRTGDLVRYRADGALQFLGRLDHQVKVRGHRVELGEIEACLRHHANVQDVVVVARTDSGGIASLVAYVVAHTPAALAVDEVRAFVRARLPEPMVPARVVSLAALPLTPNGKVDRKKLPEPDQSSAPPLASVERPANDLEQTVAEIWEEVLQVPQVGIDQNFFDLGGHSLLTVRVLGRLREATGRSLPITDMFRFPTVRSLARHMAGAVAEPAGGEMAKSDDRAASRRAMMAKRQRSRPGA